MVARGRLINHFAKTEAEKRKKGYSDATDPSLTAVGGSAGIPPPPTAADRGKALQKLDKVTKQILKLLQHNQDVDDGTKDGETKEIPEALFDTRADVLFKTVLNFYDFKESFEDPKDALDGPLNKIFRPNDDGEGIWEDQELCVFCMRPSMHEKNSSLCSEGCCSSRVCDLHYVPEGYPLPTTPVFCANYPASHAGWHFVGPRV